MWISKVSSYVVFVINTFSHKSQEIPKIIFVNFLSNLIFYDYINIFNLNFGSATFIIWQSCSLFAISVYYMLESSYIFFYLNMSFIFPTEAINTFQLNFYVQYVPSLSSNMVAAIFTPPFIFTGVILYRVYFYLGI